jgi:SAM-dependent methyltransferase
MLYFYGLGLGLEALARGMFSRETVKNIVAPENYWRGLEFRLTFNELQASPSDRILDVGSPKLLSFYLAERVKADVYSTDIEGYFISHYSGLRNMRGVPECRFHALEADGRCLPFPDGFFTRAYSISVLEHIPGNGDAVCLAEMGRVLRSGGICVVTVPFGPERGAYYRSADKFYWSQNSEPGNDRGTVFYERRYSERDLEERLIIPSGLIRCKQLYFGEKINLGADKELDQFLPPVTGPLHPLLSRLFHERPSTCWRQMKKPLGALLVLRKP